MRSRTYDGVGARRASLPSTRLPESVLQSQALGRLPAAGVQFPRDLAVCMAKRAFVLGVQMQKREYAWRKLFALTAR